jgi:hypothetical protein
MAEKHDLDEVGLTLTIAQFCRQVHCSRGLAYKLANENKIPVVRVG